MLLVVSAFFVAVGIYYDVASGHLRLTDAFSTHGLYGDRFAQSAVGTRTLAELGAVVAIGALYFAWSQARLLTLQMLHVEECRKEVYAIASGLRGLTDALRARQEPAIVTFAIFAAERRVRGENKTTSPPSTA